MVISDSQKLTAQQSKALEFIRVSIERSGTAPTLRELCRYMGYSAIGSAQDIVGALRRKGYLETPKRQSARSLRLVAGQGRARSDGHLTDEQTFVINCLGYVPAGNPLEAVEDRIGTLRMSIGMFSRPYPKASSLFAVRSRGSSMIEAGILDGDWLVVQHEAEVSEGDIVIARIGDDTTVKRLQRDQDGWYLKPENPAFMNIRASVDAPFEVIGRVIALQRTFGS